MSPKSFFLILAFDFGPLIIFYALNFLYSIKTAIFSSIMVSLFILTYMWLKKIKVSTILITSILISVIFGVLDLYSNNIIFSKYESVFINLILAVAFFSSITRNKTPIIQEFAEKQNKINKNELDDDLIYYFKFITLVWSAYFVFKAILYTILGYKFELAEIKTFKTIFGNITFYSLLVLTLFFGKRIYSVLYKFKKLPSLRLQNND